MKTSTVANKQKYKGYTMKFFTKLFITITILSSFSAELHCGCPWWLSWICGSNDDNLPALKNEEEYNKAKEDLKTLHNSLNGYFQGIASYMKDSLKLEARWNSIEPSIIENCTKNKSAKCRECLERHFLSDSEEGALYKELVDALFEYNRSHKKVLIHPKDKINNFTFPLTISDSTNEKFKNNLQKDQQEAEALRTTAECTLLSLLPKNIAGGTYLGAIFALHSKIAQEANFLIRLEVQKKLHSLSTEIDKKARQIEEYEKNHHNQPETVES